MIALKNVLVASDFSDCSDAAVRHAENVAEAFGATLHLLHVVTEPLHEMWASYAPGADFLNGVHMLEEQARKRLEARALTLADTPAVINTVWGDPSQEIIKYAADRGIDLIVCGTHGRTGLDHVVMGSVAERLVRSAPCPVMTVHAAVQSAAA